jgi:hypothetical protein
MGLRNRIRKEFNYIWAFNELNPIQLHHEQSET